MSKHRLTNTEQIEIERYLDYCEKYTEQFDPSELDIICSIQDQYEADTRLSGAQIKLLKSLCRRCKERVKDVDYEEDVGDDHDDDGPNELEEILREEEEEL